ncbi:glycerol-3-phosphate responsive antiterminator [Chakrabartyella piscis]|uniref:glycerol-3-phosphate responsive antiterminator n=1 Tax=Chakrabartyella piscis TaxID=2918914 RepID=UPI002958C82E|nr:glycerol-3-phosphate responsive antiterminator [Chakrabartyella piscis]
MFRDGKFHVIPSVRSIRYLEQALQGQEEWIMLGCPHIGNLKEMVQVCHQAGKKVIVNHELVGGLGADKVAFQFLKNMYLVDCVMGSSNSKLGLVRKENIRTIRRIALEDSYSLQVAFRSLKETKYNAIELRPAWYGIEFLKEFKKQNDTEYILGGFVNTKELVDAAYKAGFSAVATSSVELWGYEPEGK